MSEATTDDERRAVETAYDRTIKSLETGKNTPASTVYSLGVGDSFRQQDAPFSEQEAAGAKGTAKAAIFSRYGREDDAARALLNVQRSREIADQDAIRAATSDTRRPNALLKSGATDMADVTAGDTQPTSANADALSPASVARGGIFAGRAQPTKAAGDDEGGLTPYLERVAPRVIKTYLQQGKVAEAKAYSDFLDSQEGKGYTRTWGNAMRQVAAGNFEGAIPVLEKLYDSMPDGKRAKATHLGEGQYRIDWLDEKSGDVLQSKTMGAADLAHGAVMALEPTKMATWYAQRSADLEKEQIQNRRLDRQAEILDRRDEQREDRRDERLQSRLDASERNLERRLSARGGLTATQERSNLEIDAAREAIAGLTPEEIRNRTAKTTNTGRENPNFDSGLERAARLAARRKVGADDWFDQRQGQQKPAAGVDRADVAKRFRSDRAMDQYRLGSDTARGVEVLDKSGKVIGYYR